MKQTPLKPKEYKLKSSTKLKKTSVLKAKKSTLNQHSTLKNNKIPLKKDSEIKKQSTKAKTKWDAIRQKVIERDEGKCVVCGQPGTQVHHIHLRSKRKDLVYEINNLVLLCDKHHFHKSNERYEEQTELIARKKRMTVEELLKFAETKSEE